MLARAVLLTWLLAPTLAFATEGEHALSLGASYANLTVPLAQDEAVFLRGAILQLDYERGLNDTLSFRATAGGGAYSAPDGTAYSGAATVGITYAFDVLRYVPYLNLGGGVVVASGDGIDATLKPVMELGVGIDVLESRTFSWGPNIRFDSFASEAQYLTMGFRATWRWGYF